MRAGQELSYQRVGDKVIFTVPEIKAYEVVIMECRNLL